MLLPGVDSVPWPPSSSILPSKRVCDIFFILYLDNITLTIYIDASNIKKKCTLAHEDEVGALGSGAAQAQYATRDELPGQRVLLDIHLPGEVGMPLIPSQSPPIDITYPPRAARRGYFFMRV
jgi:hypothetical protein